MNDNLIEDLKIIKRVCDKINLRFFLHAGTLLGAIREHAFIANDHDFDFGVYRNELSEETKKYLIWELSVEEFIFKGYECQAFLNKLEPNFKPYILKFTSKNAHYNTDFWIFTERKNDYYHRGWLGYFSFLKETLDTLDEINFCGMKFNAPHNPELFLEHLYGKDWRIPKHMSCTDKTPGYSNWTKELKP